MIRIGIDFGGTKIEAAALAADGEVVARERRPNPGSYAAAVEVVRELNAFDTRGIVADRTLLLRIDPAQGLARADGRDRSGRADPRGGSRLM